MAPRRIPLSRRPIGFVSDTPEIVMEEAADGSDYRLAEGRAYSTISPQTWDRLIERLIEERMRIIDSGFHMEEKLKLLELNRKSLASLRHFRAEARTETPGVDPSRRWGRTLSYGKGHALRHKRT